MHIGFIVFFIQLFNSIALIIAQLQDKQNLKIPDLMLTFWAKLECDFFLVDSELYQLSNICHVMYLILFVLLSALLIFAQ